MALARRRIALRRLFAAASEFAGAACEALDEDGRALAEGCAAAGGHPRIVVSLNPRNHLATLAYVGVAGRPATRIFYGSAE